MTREHACWGVRDLWLLVYKRLLYNMLQGASLSIKLYVLESKTLFLFNQSLEFDLSGKKEKALAFLRRNVDAPSPFLLSKTDIIRLVNPK